jgi:hypothetical protein
VNVYVSRTTAHEGLIDLLIEILAVGHDDEREIPRHDAPYLLGEKDHGIRLAAALSVPEDP